MPTIIRDWTEKDLPAIALLERACFAEPWTMEMIRNEFARKEFCGALLEEDGKVIGYVCGFLLFEDAELTKVAVAERCRGNGYGGALADAFYLRAAERGAKRIFLEVRVSNQPAFKLYQSRGYEKTRLRKRYYADGEDALEMKKEFFSDDAEE